jgi:hypothetical protein
MNNINKTNGQPKRLWPWFVLAGFLLGILLAILWLSWEIKRVKRIRESTAGQAGIAPGSVAPPTAGWGPMGLRNLQS